MNREVQVTGMQVKTKVGSNLLISVTNEDKDYTSETLNQSRKALLEPVSTINGATGTFYYTVDAKANGDAVADVYTPYTETGSGTTTNRDARAAKNGYMNDFQTSYGQTADTTTDFGIAYGYVDYTFYLKATSSSQYQKVVMTKCDLDYNGDALPASGTASGAVGKVNGPDRAWRVAVFAEDITSTKPGTGVVSTDIATSGNQKGLIALADAGNQTNGKAVESTSSAAGTVLNNASANGVVIGDLGAPNVTKYYKVVVRLWLEGEDKTCTSETYAKLTEAYKLDLKYEIVASTDNDSAVKIISNDTFDASGTMFSGAQWDE